MAQVMRLNSGLSCTLASPSKLVRLALKLMLRGDRGLPRDAKTMQLLYSGVGISTALPSKLRRMRSTQTG